MIATVMFGIVFGILKLVNLLQWDWDFPAESMSLFRDALVTTWTLNHYFPIDTMFFVFGVMVMFEIGLFTVRMLFGIVSYLRGGGSIEL